MSTPPVPVAAPPTWPHCAHGADPASGPVGCRGIHVPGHTACLAHLTADHRDAYLVGLTPGADIDHRGTTFTEPLLSSLLQALRDPTTGTPHLGTARFDKAQFSGVAWFGDAKFFGDAGFDEAQFSSDAGFDEAQFSGDAGFAWARFSDTAWFDRAQFSENARFDEARFSGDARFDGARFSDRAGFARAQFSGMAAFGWTLFSRPARFDGAQFSNDARFVRAQFSDTAWFDGAQFSDTAWFDGAQFSGDARFDGAQFAAMPRFGPLVCAKTVDLSAALFEMPATFEVAAREVRCVRTRWESTATVRLRYASADLSHAVLSFPLAVTAHPAPFTNSGAVMDENLLAGFISGVQVASVQGVDAAHLILTDTDLTDCMFSGAFHLDQLRLEGRCTFASAPAGLHRRAIWPVRCTRRRTLAEEHHWRAQTSGQPTPVAGQAPSPRAWRPGPHHPDPGLTPDPEDVAAVYRQLRKAFEDGKNEPGASDFYYGEMEMRRHDRGGTPPGERVLLWGYWLLSGYGLRASRSLAWLVAAMAVTVVLIMGLGLPDSSPKQVATGAVPAGGGRVVLTVDKPDPQLTLRAGDRFTKERFDKALQVVLNSVVFRSSGQDLTAWGTYTEMASRFTEPILLALALLAMRNRIKR
ncbi:pentapeptide repeat-containing protein [Streptomyces sp. NPDC023998]|uniref:pentapeptide repeat-containing protein n=1 Tax=Streptomyces sp. NPDC023998 TaxID=3154597 RepID=UPI0033F2ACA1